MLLLFGILLLNAGISFWNAKVCGQAWVESKAVGGMIRLLVWCGAIQSAIGFSSVFIFPLVMAAHTFVPQYFTDVYYKGALNLWYLTVIFPAIGTGLIITIQSWIVAFRERSLLSMGSAAYNTFAEIHNTMGMIDSLGPAFRSVGDAFSGLLDDSSDDAKGKLAIIGLAIMISIVLIALLAGSLLTAAIIHRYAGTIPIPFERATPNARVKRT